jgi:Zn-dependent protease with chaperone function
VLWNVRTHARVARLLSAHQGGLTSVAFGPDGRLYVAQFDGLILPGGHAPAIFATHPDPDARIRQIKEFLETNYANGIPPQLTKGRALGR